jgi:hypothetical protein
MWNKRRFSMVLILSVAFMNGVCQARSTNSNPNSNPNSSPNSSPTSNPRMTQQHLVRIVMINMSGKSREVHLRDTVITLPVAERVALQVPQGESIKITSSTDRRVARVIAVASTDAGRTIPVD